jgi:hypothetical protein
MYDSLSKEIGYIQGLLEGSKLNRDSIEYQVLIRIVGMMGKLIEQNDQLDLRHQELEEYVEMIDEDLENLEAVFDDDDNEEFDEYYPSYADEGYEVEDLADQDVKVSKKE